MIPKGRRVFDGARNEHTGASVEEEKIASREPADN